MTDVDEKLNIVVLGLLRDGDGNFSPREKWNCNHHMRGCPDVRVAEVDGENGSYGCDTGCEYVRLTATLTCPHIDGSIEFDYGEFGDIAGLIADMERVSTPH